MADLYIGLMSGTSLDGVDAALVDFGADDATHPKPLTLVAHVGEAMPAPLRSEMLALNSRGDDELHRAALAANGLARLYAQAVQGLLASAKIAPAQIRAIGAHGQTVRHRPGAFDDTGYTIQLNNPALLAELTGIDVVADFRSRDVAAGGQGAPLVPAFHRAVFGKNGEAVAVVNLGGIGNLTMLNADGSTGGFDCGPGNALMDHWCHLHTGRAFDRDGAWAASGQVLPALLHSMLADPYFGLPSPKRTGRDLFNPGWLAAQLNALPEASSLAPQDVQATLAELTASSCAAAIARHAADAHRVLLCGGGAYNAHLRRRIAALLPATRVCTTDDMGLGAQQVEAAAFAWLAHAFVERRAANLVPVTGAAGPRILGALYPAHPA